MSWGKSSAERIALFERLLGDNPKVERRKMFGFPMGLANGNHFVGLHQDRILLRLAPSDEAVFMQAFDAQFFEPFPGRKSRQTLVVPDRVAADPVLLRQWFEKALAYASSLPAKKAKPVKKTPKKAKTVTKKKRKPQ
jgi:TfoX/Sxy family transcriptional regulator of competence genes